MKTRESLVERLGADPGVSPMGKAVLSAMLGRPLGALRDVTCCGDCLMGRPWGSLGWDVVLGSRDELRRNVRAAFGALGLTFREWRLVASGLRRVGAGR